MESPDHYNFFHLKLVESNFSSDQIPDSLMVTFRDENFPDFALFPDFAWLFPDIFEPIWQNQGE